MDVICTFNIDEERFNGLRSFEMDIYFALGCVWFTASSILRYGHGVTAGPTLETFQNKQQVSFRITNLFSTVSSLMHALFKKDIQTH